MPVAKIHVLEDNTTRPVSARCHGRFKMGS